MSQFFTSGDQSIGVSASASYLPMNIQDWFPLGLTGVLSLQSKGFKSFLQHHSSTASILQPSAWFMVPHDYRRNHSFDYMDICWQSNDSAFQYAKFIIAFLPRRKHCLNSWLQSPSSVILEPKKRKSVTVFIVSHLFALSWWNQVWPKSNPLWLYSGSEK